MLSTVSDTFKILACSALFFWYMPTYLIKFSVIFIVLRHIHAHWDIIMTYSGFIQAYSAPCVALAYSWPCHIRSPSVFRTRDVLKKPCETLTRHFQKPAIGNYVAIFRHIPNLVQRLHMQKTGILGYSEPFHKCNSTHIQNPVTLTKIYHYSELEHI